MQGVKNIGQIRISIPANVEAGNGIIPGGDATGIIEVGQVGGWIYPVIAVVPQVEVEVASQFNAFVLSGTPELAAFYNVAFQLNTCLRQE